MRLRTRLLALTLLMAPAAAAQNDVYDPATYQALKYRMIGPHKGSRVTAVAGIAEQPWTYFMGTNGGGLWKTTDAGESWVNVSDGYYTSSSIGAIDVADSDPSIVYVGSGSTVHPGQRLPGGRDVQVHGRRGELDPRRTPRRRADRPGDHPSAEPRRRPRGGARPRLRAQRDAGRLPDHRRRRHLGEGALRQRAHRRQRHRDGPFQPERALRDHVDRGAEALDHHLGE